MRGATARRLLAASALAGLLVGIPSVLMRLGGWPLPRHLPDAATFDRLLSGRVEVDAAKVIVVVVWTAALPLLVGLAVELVSCIRGMPAPRLPVIGPIQPILARLVTTAVLTTAPSIPRPALAAVPAPAVVLADAAPAGTFGQLAAETTFVSAREGPEARARSDEIRPSYQVKRFDTFIGIAEELLPGGASRWPELFELNRGSVQPNGKPLLRPQDLEEDAVIVLPWDATVGVNHGGTGSVDPHPETADGISDSLGRGGTERAAHDDAANVGLTDETEVPEGWEFVTVRTGDREWDRVEQRVPGASQARVKEIVDAVDAMNRGRPQPSYGKFVSINNTHPGWRILHPIRVSPELGAPIPAPPSGTAAPAPTAPGESTSSEQERPEHSDAGTSTTSATVISEGDREDAAQGVPASGDSADGPARAPHNEPTAARGGSGAEPADGHIRLPSGSYIPLSFAAGFFAHVAMARLHRRRHYRPGVPLPGIPSSPKSPDEPVVVAARSRQADALGAPMAQVHDESLRFCGEGSGDAARAAVIASLLRRPPPNRHPIWLDCQLCDELLGELSIPDAKRFSSEAALLDELEIERTRRTRLLAEAGAADLDAFRDCDVADESVDDLLVVASASAPQAGRWSSLVDAGPRLGMRILFLGGADAGTATVDVAAGGVVAGGAFGGSAEPMLTPADAAVFVEQIAAARSGLAEDAADHEPAADTDFPFDEIDTGRSAGSETPRVTVCVFDRVTASVAGREIDAGVRESARELLAYLAYRPAGERREAIVDALWQDHDANRANRAFRNAVPSLRSWVRELVGRRDIDVVVSSGDGRYRLEADLFDVDLWAFQTALRHALEEEAPSDRAVLRRQALSLYSGDFAPGVSSEWAAWAREKLREKAVDTAVSIAEFEEQERGDLEAALAAVERALEIDPLVEDLYVRGVRLLAGLGRLDSARRLYAMLQSKLDTELGVDPSEATREAVGALLVEAERRRAGMEARGGPRHGAPESASTG